MKNMVLAALAALTLGAAVVPAAYAAPSVAADRAATLMQRTGSYGGIGGGN